MSNARWQFRLLLSMSDLFEWADDDTPLLKSEWRQLVDCLGIDIPSLMALHTLYFDGTAVGAGDVHVLSSQLQPNRVLVMDLYRELTDQQDMVSLLISIPQHLNREVRERVRRVFDQASCALHYEEGCYLKAFSELTDAQRYPRVIEESGYRQQLITS